MENSKDHKAAAKPPLDCNVGPKIERYLLQLAPHQTEREGPKLLRSALAAIDGLTRYAQHQQARIDVLMLEYCPDEMTPEQMEEWGRNQRPVSDEQQQMIDAALRKHKENFEG
ncbi:MAG: hypothetical protein KGL39_58520 [Patescibacteria group bacterium]|nr:hypothetical protein [Patescibacteria group bacterium]